MDAEIIITEVIVAALAIIGGYGILHACLETWLRPRELAVAVRLTREVEAGELDILLCEARRAPWSIRRREVILILPVELLDGRMGEDGRLYEEYAELAEKYEVEVCLLSHAETDHENE